MFLSCFKSRNLQLTKINVIFSRCLTEKTSVDQEEINRFRRLSSFWWNETGEYAALHSLNKLRVPLIRDQLIQSSNRKVGHPIQPLEGIKLLDVGCGGGILTEPLARLGASVLGIDAVSENISTAQLHADLSLASHLKYKAVTLEELCKNVEHQNSYDGIIASELLEHITDVDHFIGNMGKLLKPKGLCFVTTLNQTLASYFLGILTAEYILRIVPPGTHTWSKFLRPQDLTNLFKKNGFSVFLVHGMFYNPVTNQWSWSTNQAINYALCAEKQ